MAAVKNLEEKIVTEVNGKPHIFSIERGENGKYIKIYLKNKEYIRYSTMEIINILNKISDINLHVHASPYEFKIEYKPKYWREIKSILTDVRHVFGNGYHK